MNITIILVLLAAIGVAAYFFLSKKNDENVEPPAPTPTSTDTNNNDTPNWSV